VVTEVVFARKGPFALLALKGLVPGMGAHMRGEVVLLSKTFVALVALVLAHPGMGPQVGIKSKAVTTPRPTDVTLVIGVIFRVAEDSAVQTHRLSLTEGGIWHAVICIGPPKGEPLFYERSTGAPSTLVHRVVTDKVRDLRYSERTAIMASNFGTKRNQLSKARKLSPKQTPPRRRERRHRRRRRQRTTQKKSFWRPKRYPL